MVRFDTYYLDALDRLHLTEKTIIIFTSDNGGNMYDRVKGTTPTNNHPLRNGKGNIYEGGVREPSIVVWPGVVKPGSECMDIISSIDFYPTMLEMAGLKKKKGQIVDGESLVPLLRGSGPKGRWGHATDLRPGQLPSNAFHIFPNMLLVRFVSQEKCRMKGRNEFHTMIVVKLSS